MMQPANPNLLPVSEAAREAATSLAEARGDRTASEMRDGLFDAGATCQAFAAFEQSKDAAFVAMLEGMKGNGALLMRERIRNAVIDEAIANAKAGRAGS